jgi:membrane protease YdiL (CAAX protease family)
MTDGEEEKPEGPADGLEQPTRRRINGYDVLLVTAAIIIFVAIGIVVVSVVMAMTAADVGRLRGLSLGYVLLILSVQVTAIVAAVYLVLQLRKDFNWADLGLLPLRRRHLALAALAGLALAPLTAAAERLLDLSINMAPLVAPQGFSWSGLLGMLLLVGIATPFCEEIYFRGVLYGWMRGRWRPAIAIPASALVFGFSHFYYPLPLMLLVAVLGVVFALAYERSGSLWAPVGIHGAYNSAVVAAIYASLAIDGAGA